MLTIKDHKNCVCKNKFVGDLLANVPVLLMKL